MAALDLQTVELGTVLLIHTDDRKHPFRATVDTVGPHGINVSTARSGGTIVLGDSGAISHFSRYGVRRGVFPRCARVHSVQLAQ